jgi:hypothetical protein
MSSKYELGIEKNRALMVKFSGIRMYAENGELGRGPVGTL